MLIAVAALLAGQELAGTVVNINPIGNNLFELRLMQKATRLDPPKYSPKKFGDDPWEFDWITVGAGVETDPNQMRVKVRVYSQERKDSNDKGLAVARMVMQIWDRGYHRYKIDSPGDINQGIVDYFLCFGGKPGGEQLFDTEYLPKQSQPVKVNTIYIYQLSTFKDPVEMAREVAHEYGHAVLPAVGGFKQPEVWANGYLGEKLFLQWFRNDMIAKKLVPDDAMGASLDGLDNWVSKNVDPLIQQAAYAFPAPNLINEAKGGMDAFLGLALYVNALCPPSVFLRSLEYTRDAHKGGDRDLTPPTDYAQNVVMAASEVENLTFSIPKAIFDSKKPIWIPLGKGKVTGGSVIAKKDGWAEVAPLMPTLMIKNPPLR